MPIKLINATELRSGSFAIINEAPCVVKSIDISKSGKHGASKCRVEAIGLIDGKKRIIAVPGSQRISVPLVDKRRAQVLGLNKEAKKASIMDSESFETLDVKIGEDLLEDIKENDNIEYWNIEGEKIIKRIL